MHNWHSVGRKVHIEFESVGAGLEPEVERCERILGAESTSAAVREDLRPAAVKERHKSQSPSHKSQRVQCFLLCLVTWAL